LPYSDKAVLRRSGQATTRLKEKSTGSLDRGPVFCGRLARIAIADQDKIHQWPAYACRFSLDLDVKGDEFNYSH